MIYTEELSTGKVVHIPSFEVEIVQSDAHEELIKLNWTLVGWSNDKEMQI